MDYGARLKDLIGESDMKQKAVAKSLHMTESTLSNYVTGRTSIPADALVKFAEYFQVTTDYLLGLTDEPKVPLRLSDAERRLILDLRTLSPDQKAVAGQTVQLMAEQNRR